MEVIIEGKDVDCCLQQVVIRGQHSEGRENIDCVEIVGINEEAPRALSGCSSVSIKKSGVNAQGFKIKDEIRVVMVGGWRIVGDIEARVPKPHTLRASIAIKSQSSILKRPRNRFEEIYS